MTSIQHEGSGKLVALEGDVNMIATQLRLLPPSQKILVLPSMLDKFPHDTNAQTFNARAFIRNAHTAFAEQIDRAHTFLHSSTISQPKLVFTNGGSVRARTTCIAKICEHVTNGNVTEAEIIFNEIVKDGVAGLMKEEDVLEEIVPTPDENRDLTDGDNEVMQEEAESMEDPSAKAMRAADSLDRETAELQEEQMEEPVESTESVNGDACATHLPEVEGPARSDGDDIVTTVLTVPPKKRTKSRRGTVNSLAAGTPITPYTSSTHYTVARSQQTDDDNSHDDDDDEEMVSPGGQSFFSMPATPVVVYGEARVVDLQTSPSKLPRKVKSVDFHQNGPPAFADWQSTRPSQLKHTKSAFHLSQKSRIQEGHQQYEAIQPLPKTLFMKASTTTIRKSPSLSRSVSSSASTPRVRVYVDRGTDAQIELVDQLPEEVPVEIPPFEPVFPLVEDLVIHCAHDDPYEVFESVLSSYRNGSYPILPEEEPETTSVPESPSSADADDATLRPTSNITAETDDDGFHRRNEFDPYASNNYSGGINQWPLKIAQEEVSTRNLKPPSPCLTPPPSVRGIPQKFCAFSPVNSDSVIGIQNSLRSLLNLHFPAGENGYTQHYFPVSPETERLWKPVFRNDETSTIGNEGGTVDQIIALGCEDGVKKELFSQVSGQIEKLGMKRDGSSRSSKIHLRYFISTIMQTHSNLPLHTQSTFNPLSSPEVLAACIVPQIEAYLAINTGIRLLILQFEFKQLSLIMALRQILGQNVLKIAGIMDSTSSDPPSLASAPKANPLSNEATSKIRKHSNTSTSSKISEPGASFSKANYLLLSAANEAETTTFLSEIETTLIGISPFYIPEPEPKLFVAPPIPPTPETSYRDSTSHPPVAYRKRSPSARGNESKLARLTGATPPRTPTDGKGHKYAASIASTVRTTASGRIRKEEARVEKEWENFYIGEEDSEDDDYDRMVMGRAGARIVPEVKIITSDGKAPKRSTKKALKWLGLA